MSLIVGEGITKRWTDKDVLHNVGFTLAPGERVGLVGPNGEGKTTLLRILAGLETPTEGKLSIASTVRVGYLPQDVPVLEGSTLRGAMLDVFAHLHEMERQLHEMADRMQEPDGDGQAAHDKLLAEYGELQHQFEDAGGYAFSHKIDAILSGLGFDESQWEMPLAKLSGGQRTRGYLAKLLLQEPSVLLLDEPTNHLDLEAVEWLEKWLSQFPGALVVVSHDRYFLDAVTTRTWEISFSQLEAYRGGYSEYLPKRHERYLERMKLYEAQQQYVQETQEFIRRFLAGQRSKEAQGRRTRLERFLRDEAIPKPQEHSRISVRFQSCGRTGDFVLRLEDLQAGYDKSRPLVHIDALDVQRGQRIAIVGPNGCGKTTLLRTILGQLSPLAGKIRPGSNVTLGYLSQTHTELKSHWTALEAVREADPLLSEEKARGMLGALLLSGDHVYKQVCELSGGQRSRVVLARLMLQQANVLVLDEPTNHLDVLSQEVLQEVLADFSGTIIFVSHDRYLIKALATDIWAIGPAADAARTAPAATASVGANPGFEGPNQVTVLRGDWMTYLAWRDKQGALSHEETASLQKAQQAKQDRKEDFQERKRRTNELQKMQRRLAEVEKLIADMEESIRKVNADLEHASNSGDVDRITRLGKDYSTSTARLESLLREWEELSASIAG